jgi:hypothetical protein
MEIIKSLIPPANVNRPDAHQPEYITIHETGNPSKGADAAAHSKYLNGLKEKISWHYTVDDHCAYQHLPDWEGGYHAGDGSGDGNRKSIGIEMCVNQDGNYEQTLRNTAELVRQLMGTYGISLSHVVQHNHWNGKDCPQQLRKAGRWQEFLNMVGGTNVRASEYTKLSSRLHMVKIPIERFRLLMWDKPKKTTVIKDYFNAGYFAGYKENGAGFTLPVANLMADQGDLGEPSLKYLKEWGKVEGGKVSCDTRRNASNQFKDKLVSTLIVTGDRAYIDQVNQLPAGAKYAVSGIPVIRNGQDVSYSKEVVAEGWDASPLYATWHGMLAVDGSDSIYYLAWQSTSKNLITTCEAWNAFKSYGFTDMILLDGGGSFVLDHGGKNVAVTGENRRINTVGLY